MTGDDLAEDFTEVTENGVTVYIDARGREWPSPSDLLASIKAKLNPGGVFVNPRTGETIKREDM